MLSQIIGKGSSAFDRLPRFFQNIRINAVAHDIRSDLYGSHYGDAGREHGIHVIRDAGKIKLSKKIAENGKIYFKAVQVKLALACPGKPPKVEPANNKKYQKENSIIYEKA